MPEPDLLTERLHLRLTDGGDADLYRALYSDPAVMRWVGPVRSTDETARIHARVCVHNAKPLPGHRFWVMRWRATGEAFGIASLRREGQVGEIGALSFPEAWNRGATREAFGAILTRAFDDYGMDRVDVDRPDDAQAAVVHRMLSPLRFAEVPAAHGRRRWSIAARAG